MEDTKVYVFVVDLFGEVLGEPEYAAINPGVRDGIAGKTITIDRPIPGHDSEIVGIKNPRKLAIAKVQIPGSDKFTEQLKVKKMIGMPDVLWFKSPGVLKYMWECNEQDVCMAYIADVTGLTLPYKKPILVK